MCSDKERGVRSKAVFTPGEFVMEYEANLLDEQQLKLAETENENEGEKIYVVETPKGYFDATYRVNSIGRYINHAAKEPNLLLRQLIEARGRWRIGFVAKTSISPGDELFWDYGFR